jgi:AcrR family transcriptional regulator
MDLLERRRLATLLDIETAAIDLFELRGYDHVTVDQIAAAAGISVRTFYRHCEAKEEAFTTHLLHGARELSAEIAARVGSAPLATAVERGFLATVAAHHTPPNLRRMIAICLREPVLRARWLDAGREGRERIAPIIATLLEPSDPLVAKVVAAAVIGALTVALEEWSAATDGLDAHVARALAPIRTLMQLPEHAADSPAGGAGGTLGV